MGGRERRWGRLVVGATTCLAVVSVLASGAASAASSALYVGDAEEYAVAFKAEGARLYVMELAGTTHCYYTEPPEDAGPGGFSVFPAPKLMRSGPRGFVAEEIVGSMYGGGYARVRAELDGNAVSGDFSFDESEESFHCDTAEPFQTFRYLPVGSAGAAAPASGEKRAYYGSEGPIEIFLRTTGKEAGGIRGTFVPRCPLGKGRRIPARHTLFPRPTFAKLSEDGRFRRRVVQEGRTSSGARFKETVSLAGTVEQGVVAGSYRRVRTARAGRQRCVTGPLAFRAIRYLRAAG